MKSLEHLGIFRGKKISSFSCNVEKNANIFSVSKVSQHWQINRGDKNVHNTVPLFFFEYMQYLAYLFIKTYSWF